MPRSIARHVLALGICLSGVTQTAQAAITFTETTSLANIQYVGESYGASWGDLNGDGWPDLYVSNHRAFPSLYVNRRDGTFSDIGGSIALWGNDPDADMHGGAWNDFDNDGDSDLYIGTGRVDPHQFFVNQNGALVDRTATYNPDVAQWPGRLPIFFDFDDDGLLDFLMASGESVGDDGSLPNLIFQQAPGGFVDRTADTGLACFSAQIVLLVDVVGDDRLELLCGFGKFPEGVYETSTLPFGDVTGAVPEFGPIQDVAVGDFDNNGKMDLFMVRGATRLTEAVKTGDRSVEAQVITNGTDEKGFRFSSTGDLTVRMETQSIAPSQIRVGLAGMSPAALPFTLSPDDAGTWGIAEHESATDTGLYIGYDTATQQWEFRVSPGGSWVYVWLGIDTTGTVDDVTTFGLATAEQPLAPVLLMQGETGWKNATGSAGLSEPLQCIAAAAGDFDNDMDMDLYVVCRQGLSNLVNRLYENDGNGVFTEVAGAGGAGGVTGPGAAGTGENVALADYDMDGFLDIYVTNGLNMQPPGKGGPDQLFRNTSGDRVGANHWIQLDLRGTASNRDAIGAKVFVTAGGVTQVREQGGGYHRWAQHHQRLHVGLGQNETAQVRVLWPSGAEQVFDAVGANEFYEIVEGGDIRPLSNPPFRGIDAILQLLLSE
jgi:hypothetical protein